MISMRVNCGCGRLAEWAVYEHKEPHCFHCMEEASVCEGVIIQRVYDWNEIRREQKKNEALQGVTL